LIEARRKDPKAQLRPEVSADIIGSGHLREGEIKEAIEVFQLNLLAYRDSADAHFNLADAYLQDRQKDLAGQYAEKALAPAGFAHSPFILLVRYRGTPRRDPSGHTGHAEETG
jgi:tetratricopeptide (TPR) repeat protein